jgi:hypothetical protein
MSVALPVNIELSILGFCYFPYIVIPFPIKEENSYSQRRLRYLVEVYFTVI